MQYVCIVEWLIQLINTSIPWWGGRPEYQKSTLRNVWKWTAVDERGLRSLNKMPCVRAQIKKLKASRAVVAHAFNPSTREAEAGESL